MTFMHGPVCLEPTTAWSHLAVCEQPRMLCNQPTYYSQCTVQLRMLCGKEEQHASFQHAMEREDPGIEGMYELTIM